MSKTLQLERFHLGVCYYPEHWPPALWDDDFRRMTEMDFSVVRVAEFAWSLMEPSEGAFTWDFWDRVMESAHAHDLKVILSTPTATPPAWLTHKYPEVLNRTQAGVTYQHGQRRHTGYNAPVYRDLCARVAGEMAAHYADHPALMAWQIDNELNCEVNVFYADADHHAFRTWLRARYGSLDALNRAWAATFWNQTYDDWAQVYLTRPTPSDAPNPHQALDEKRFISDSAIAFARVQADAIRAHDAVHPITTNGLFGHLDSHRLTDELLDFFSYDSYPQFAALWPDGGEDALLDRRWGMNLSITRDISPNFCVMEQQSGPGGWVNRIEQPSPKPGQMRLWTYQSVAHGADAVLYFRWRTAPFGTEIYWHGLNDYHNQPNRRCDEAAQVGRELGQIGEQIAGSRYVADVALLKDYDNEWDGELDTWHGPYERQSLLAWYKALQRSHVPADMVYLRPGVTTAADLARYRCLVYPHATILTDETASVLKEYVAAGGTLIFGCRTGYKNENGHCPMRPFPGAVADLCGVTVEDFTRIGPHETAPALRWEAMAGAAPLSTGAFNDILHIESDATARVLATYADPEGNTGACYYVGKPALIENGWGTGRAITFGGVFTVSVARALLRHLEIASPLEGRVSLPPDVELAVREQPDGGRFAFLLNYAATPQTITVHQPATNLLSGDTLQGAVVLPPYDVLVLRL